MRIANERGSLGISCKLSGLHLAGVPLLRRTSEGFEPRPQREIEYLLDRAYLGEVDGIRLLSGIGLVAKALNESNLARAMISSLLLELPELDWYAAIRIAYSDNNLSKYPGQPRGWHQYYGPGKQDKAGPYGVGDAEEVAYQGTYHDTVVEGLAAVARAGGAKVITEVKLVGVDGTAARVDLLIAHPPYKSLILVEVKTGKNPTYTDAQRIIYPMAQIGGHVYSPDPKIEEFGYAPGELLPAMEFVTLYKSDEKSPLQEFPHEDPTVP